jgi:putative DNA primase/helicase
MTFDPEDEATPAVASAGATSENNVNRNSSAEDRFQRKAARGSFSPDDPDRPQWEPTTQLVAEYAYHRRDGSYSYSKLKGLRADGEKTFLTARRVVGGMDDLQIEMQNNPHGFFRLPGLEHFLKGAGDEPDVLYRWPELLEALAARPTERVFIKEGEKDADTLIRRGLIATTNPNGATNWRSSFNSTFAGRDVIVSVDNDDKGRERADKLVRELSPVARSVTRLELPGLAAKGDVTDYFEAGNTLEDFLRAVEDAVTNSTRREDDGADLQPSEHAIALEFTRRHRDNLLYDHDAGAWYLWDASRWRKEATGLAFERCRRIAAAGEGGRAMQKASVASGAERFARSDRAHAVESSCWDSDPMLAATPGGPTIDLGTGATRPPNPADRMTKVLGFVPEDGEPVLWLRSLREWTGGDEEQVRFLQQFLGYCLTGLTDEHALLFLFGSGGNGKSVFLNTVLAVMGEYAMTAGMETFTASKNERHSTELARLRGARVVTGSEVEEGKEFNSARIKQATGGDPITARFMHKNDFTYNPQFKLIFSANDQPRLHQVDDAMKRRINMLPFLHKPPVPDPFLEQNLKLEGGRILNWMIAGCLDWQLNRAKRGGSGLIRPDAVKAATADYFEGQDVFNQWIEERCVLGRDKQEQSSLLYRSWVDYALKIGEESGTQTAFGLRLGKRFSKAKPGGKRGFAGIALGSVSIPEEAM